MKKWQALTAGVFFVAAANLMFINAGRVSLDATGATGLKPMTDEEIEKLTKHKIRKVNPNSLGLERINKERKKRGLRDIQKSNHKEVETNDDPVNSAAADSLSAQEMSGSAVAAVDNSTLPAFPPIGNQGNEGSCVTWSIAYYMMSHEVCLATGCDNKANPSQAYSPRFVYNMINNGVDGGSNSSDAFNVIANHGAPRLSELPYVAGDYRKWDLNPEHWRTAINSRVSSTLSLLITTDAGMATVKQALLNGHVLVFGTYVNSWVYSTVKADPNSASPFAGQWIMSYMNGTAGGHLMTIVGYDDSIWNDINGNGIVEAAELGAFKVANSWGTGYKNGGFVWASYDAFRTTTAVPGFTASRIKLTQGDYVAYATHTPYSPKLLAKVTVSHLSRNQMNLRIASSALTSGTPQAYTPTGALTNKGGAYAFDGSTAEVEGTFYLDATSLSPTGSVSDKNYYLVSGDNSAGNPLTVKSFELVNPAVGNTLASAGGVPFIADATTKNLMIGSYAPDTQAPSVPGALTATVVSQKKGKRVTSSISLKWTASTDNLGTVSSYRIYRNGSSLGSTTSLSFTDANGAAGVVYNYEVAAVDPSGNVSARASILKGK